MSLFRAMLLLILLLSCKNEQKNKSVSNKQINSEVNESKGSEAVRVKSEKPNYPDWLKQLHIKESSENTSAEVESFNQINDSLSSAVILYYDGVCSTSMLYTYLSKKLVDEMKIAISCAHDESVLQYRWSEYKFEDDRTIWQQDYFETIPDSLINQTGNINEGIDLEEFRKTTRGITLRHRILDSGKITAAIID